MVLVVLLAFELPRLLHRSHSSSATPAVTTIGTLTTPATSNPGAPAASGASGAQATKRAATPAFGRLAARDPFAERTSDSVRDPDAVPSTAPLPGRDPFAPAVGAQAPTLTQPQPVVTPTPVTPTPVTPVAKPKPVAPVVKPVAPVVKPVAPVVKPVAPVAKPVTKPAVTTPKPVQPAKPVVVPVIAPTAAVIWLNGHRRVIGLLEKFKIGDTWFRLVGLTAGTAKIRLVVGGFDGGAQAIKIQRTENVTLTNVATGVEYTIRFTLATTAKPVSTKAAGR